ncbi:hypothetical protein GF354_01285 [Candidatus Peregrinibacteria bacterium]|nr:hypothetical protein [Candidatus Peregrinibacteria bacterium]
MKNIISIISGVLIGTGLSLVVILNPASYTAFGEITYEDFEYYFVSGNDLSWYDVFGPNEEGQELYNLMYDKYQIEAPNEALRVLAQKYGLTVDEADKVLNGSIVPIFNTENGGTGLYTKTRAYEIQKQLQQDYEDFSEQLQLEQEMDALITPSEIFANGDLSDSGFDLLHDLDQIEEILFFEKSPVSVGDPFSDELDTPYKPTDDDYQHEDFVASLTDSGVLRSPTATGSTVDEEVGAGAGNGDSSGEVSGQEESEDACPIDSPLKDALSDFDESAAGLEESDADDGDDGAGSAASLQDGAGSVDSTPDSTGDQDYTLVSNQNINAAPRGVWGKAWCPALNNEPDRSYGDNYATTVGVEGFNSLSPDNVVKTVLDGALGAGTGVVFDLPGVEIQAAVCLDIETVWETVSSYLPGQSCIQCEIEKINEIMDKTLSHSLTPNKVTGNLMETAKCKKSYQLLNSLDMQIITIAAPIATPSNDDLIFGSNIWKEWNDFVEKYRPFLSDAGKVPDQYTEEFELASAPIGYGTSQAIVDIRNIKAENTAQALGEVTVKDNSLAGTTVQMYSQALYGEMKQTTAFFENFRKIFEDINSNACQAIKSKSDET